LPVFPGSKNLLKSQFHISWIYLLAKKSCLQIRYCKGKIYTFNKCFVRKILWFQEILNDDMEARCAAMRMKCQKRMLQSNFIGILLIFFCSELTFGMYQDKRWEIIFSVLIKVGTCFYLMLILFCLIKKYSKNQDSLLFFYTATFYFTIESRPQALWILAVS
jgi:hypothetical protein